jgi:antitoxin component of MazEF toxin-antitoxin module
MFNDLMKEVNAKKKQEISAKNVNVQANTNLTAKQQQKKEQDEIEDMLAGL